MILDGEYQWIVGLLKGVLLAGRDHVPEEDPGGESVAVVDERLPIVPVPTINCSIRDSE